MIVATWNVNSIRIREDAVINWLKENPVDVLCLQETKVVDTDFPQSLFTDLGYHIYAFGQKSYNGVAIISKQPLENVSTGFAPLIGLNDLDEQKRLITGTLDDVKIVCVYVPNGGAIESEKYLYKLQWLKALREYLRFALYEISNICICGDFNIALEDKDIHAPALLTGQTMATELERQALREIIDLGFADAFRKFTTEGGNYSWWDYRAAAFRRNLGWRIDHHYLTSDLYKQATSCIIDTTVRKLTQPSDHAPVIVEF
ncbi:exodeoxyribonuclease III [Chlorogloea sp. CCALA 695]|uniref:exodeoxyribonuclease III n=1 Tax=Chlorogloea sp. CCALA 695 TaxID=2107693 RepID=UPI000D053594|nr:exodeoxyribonuclease III [Chlorogloea sp. CCALA 695]PSB35452.1 exodeoxyribonuclease III [Chlorogloea sp. CCALA 695]